MMTLIRDATSDDVDADIAPLSQAREWGTAGSMSLPEDLLALKEGSGAPAVDEQEALGIGSSRAQRSDASGILKESERKPSPSRGCFRAARHQSQGALMGGCS